MDHCKTCRYHVMLTCRRHAPQAALLGKLERQYQARNLTYAVAAWPAVHDDDWCGEYQRHSGDNGDGK